MEVRKSEPLPEPLAENSFPKSSRPKTTFSLSGINKPREAEVVKKEQASTEKVFTEVKAEELATVWLEYAETRRDQIAEFQILKREYLFEYPMITLTLSNPVEETLLDNFKRDFVQYLRDRLKNSELSVQSVIQQATGKKVIYTSKEKFDHLAEKHPYLKELKDRLGLDWDY